MEMGQYRSLEQSNARLRDWIHEELARGEAWQRQYEALVERQTRLGTLLRAKSLQALEQKGQARQQELEEVQEALRECGGRRSQCQLHLRKQEKENRRLAESVTELENQVSKQRRKETSGKELLREMRVEGAQLKRHLSTWEAECRAEDARATERQQQLQKRRATLRELSLRSQELHRSRAPLEDRVIEAQLEAQRFQKKSFFGQARPQFLWKELAPDWMKRLLCQEPEGISSVEELPPRCSLGPSLWTACCLLWALAKALFLLLFAMALALALLGSFSACPCAPLPCAPLLYVQPQGLRPPLYS